VLVFLCLAALSCSAETVQLQVVSPVQQFSPLNLLMNGNPIQGACISPFTELAPYWTAYVLFLPDFPADQQTDLLEAAWLYEQFSVNAVNRDKTWRGIYSAIWDLFGDNLPAGRNYYGVDWLALAADNYRSVDPASFEVLVPIHGGESQSILTHHNPEPAPVLLIATGLILILKLRKGSPHIRR
jgi:hypothetical protein